MRGDVHIWWQRGELYEPYSLAGDAFPEGEHQRLLRGRPASAEPMPDLSRLHRCWGSVSRCQAL